MADQPKPQYQKPQPQVADKESASFRYIVRIANTDLDGKKKLLMGLQKIKGVSFMMSNAFCAVSGVNPRTRIGDLSEADVAKLDALIKNQKPAIPSWLMNRRKDMETGDNLHQIGADLTFSHESDIRLLKKIKCYRGVRHMQNAPVRGQRTRSNFRKNKGKVASVLRSATAKATAPAAGKEKK